MPLKIYPRSIHLAKIGWGNYESAGRATGTIDLSKKIEALKICLESDVLPTEEQLIEMIKERK